MPELIVEYEGAQLRVDIAADAKSSPDSPSTWQAYLYINAMQRDSAVITPGTKIIRLASVVQTDYEWHEHIESVVLVTPTNFTISLSASKLELATQTFSIDFDG